MPELARLPALSAEELGELEHALRQRISDLGLWGDTLTKREVCRSLLTAVFEAQYSLRGIRE
jgi:hypothetical protein